MRGAHLARSALRRDIAPMREPESYARIYAIVKRIPPGRVATYGQVAALAGLPGAARQVGYALHATPRGLNLPWQRVVNAQGAISRRADPDDEVHQRRLLEAEGVRFDARGRIVLERYRWRPKGGVRTEEDLF
jgi:methylated-DNA-protein-cysteine methyltransferase-like protein